MLNAAFFDTLDADLERLQRINQTVCLLDEAKLRAHPHRLREIPILTIRPSEDLGKLASDPSSYTQRLLELGYRDALAQRDEIAEFLR